MSVSMRAKLTIESINKTQYSEQIKYRAIYTNNKEDNSYSDATPCAEASFTITNKELWGKFNPGDQFYVDFVPVVKQ